MNGVKTGFSFAEIEKPLIEVALADRQLRAQERSSWLDDPSLASQKWNVGEVSKYMRNGWIYFDFPLSPEELTARVRGQVWTGYGERPRFSDNELTDTLKLSLPSGLFEAPACLALDTHRTLYAHPENFYSRHDQTLPAEDLLVRGVEWIVNKTLELTDQNQAA